MVTGVIWELFNDFQKNYQIFYLGWNTESSKNCLSDYKMRLKLLSKVPYLFASAHIFSYNPH